MCGKTKKSDCAIANEISSIEYDQNADDRFKLSHHSTPMNQNKNESRRAREGRGGGFETATNIHPPQDQQPQQKAKVTYTAYMP